MCVVVCGPEVHGENDARRNNETDDDAQTPQTDEDTPTIEPQSKNKSASKQCTKASGRLRLNESRPSSRKTPQTVSTRAMVLVAPKVRTTRSGPRETEPRYREIVKILRVKADAEKRVWYKVLCRGDHPVRAFWVERHSMKGDGVQILIDECRGK